MGVYIHKYDQNITFATIIVGVFAYAKKHAKDDKYSVLPIPNAIGIDNLLLGSGLYAVLFINLSNLTSIIWLNVYEAIANA